MWKRTAILWCNHTISLCITKIRHSIYTSSKHESEHVFQRRMKITKKKSRQKHVPFEIWLFTKISIVLVEMERDRQIKCKNDFYLVRLQNKVVLWWIQSVEKKNYDFIIFSENDGYSKFPIKSHSFIHQDVIDQICVFALNIICSPKWIYLRPVAICNASWYHAQLFTMSSWLQSSFSVYLFFLMPFSR